MHSAARDPEKKGGKRQIDRAEAHSAAVIRHASRPKRRTCFGRGGSANDLAPKPLSQSSPRKRTSAVMQLPYTIVAFSHLRWNFVYQRPQHLLSRLAARHPVIFVEEPQLDADGPARWDRSSPHPGVTVYRPLTPVAAPGFHRDQLPLLEPLMVELGSDLGEANLLAWLYTPMALPLARRLDPEAAVYDCMDELSLFAGAPPELLALEAQLLEFADLMFTGGPSLYRAKQSRHPNVHCFSSSVDAAHFRLRDEVGNEVSEAEDQEEIPHPRLGFYGVIDERLDLEIVQWLAATHPDWQIVLVGPVVKIDPALLPRAGNIHYFGQRTYEELPRYLAGWDVCLLPFARNDATRFISPTKTLEYMAAELPIVSTPIADVAEPYGHIVYLGGTPEEFVAACEVAMSSSDEERAARAAQMRQVLAGTSWDVTAAAMEELLTAATATAHGTRKDPGSHMPPKHTDRSNRAAPVVIIGAGPTGLSAAYHLGEDALLVERADRVGGWCRSIEDNGFTFDMAGHIMFSKDPYVHEMYRLLLGENVHWQDREAWIYSKNVYTRYPFQGALYGLPPEVISECIVGAIEARFGSLTAKKPAADKAANGDYTGPDRRGMFEPLMKANGKGKLLAYSGTERRTTPIHKGEPRNFEEFIYKVWGAGIARHFAIPYNQKLWAVPLSEMETSWLGGRVPLPNLEEMIHGALSPAPKPMGPNARFGYPLRGGFQALMDGFLPHLKGELRLNTHVTAVSPKRHTVTLADGSVVPYEYLISTMPLPALVHIIGPEAPAEVRRAAAALRHVSVRCVNIGVGRENLTEKHWIYYPEDPVFHRIFVQGNASPHCNPPGGFGLTCEITYSQAKPLPVDGDALIQRCIEDCHKVGFFTPEDPIRAAHQVDLPVAYVVYDHDRAENVKLIREWLSAQDIVMAGRYAEWEYYNSDHAFIAGRKAAEDVAGLRQRQFMDFPAALSSSAK
jgi:UDP-galactopyranose mutase